jgi:hypothetical protein
VPHFICSIFLNSETTRNVCTEPEFVNVEGAQESIPAGRFDSTIDVLARQATQAGGTDSLESIPGLLTRLRMRAQYNDALSMLFNMHILMKVQSFLNPHCEIKLEEKAAVQKYYMRKDF